MRSGSRTLVAVCLGLMACGDTAPVTKGTMYAPGTPVDLDGDGKYDGKAIDINNDGISDGVDTDLDGDVDKPLPSTSGPIATPDGSDNGDGTTGGDGSTGVDGSSGDGTDPAICVPSAVVPSQSVPDMLIVLDRSGSMNDNNRWDASVAALRAVTATLDSGINFGLMAFPGAVAPTQPAMDCSQITDFFQRLQCEAQNAIGGFGGGATCEAGSVVVPIGPGTSGEIDSALGMMQPSGSTPTADSLEAAGELLGEYVPAPDEAVRPKYVLLVTDGEPKCNGDDEDSVAASVAAVEALTAKGIKTYVIGYDTQGSASMDAMAAAGGTGSTAHIPVENEQQLVDALSVIAGKAASCTYTLTEKPNNPENVLVKVDGQPIFTQNGEWTFSEDGLQVQVQGARCEQLQSPGQHALTVDILCEVVIPF